MYWDWFHIGNRLQENPTKFSANTLVHRTKPYIKTFILACFCDHGLDFRENEVMWEHRNISHTNSKCVPQKGLQPETGYNWRATQYLSDPMHTFDTSDRWSVMICMICMIYSHFYDTDLSRQICSRSYRIYIVVHVAAWNPNIARLSWAGPVSIQDPAQPLTTAGEALDDLARSWSVRGLHTLH